jgi:hypothetical protein
VLSEGIRLFQRVRMFSEKIFSKILSGALPLKPSLVRFSKYMIRVI